MRLACAILAPLLLAAGCGDAQQPVAPQPDGRVEPAPERTPATAVGPIPAAAPQSDADMASPEAAVARVERYYRLAGSGDYDAAAALWHDADTPDEVTPREFARRMAHYDALEAQVGTPGRVEGAAGSVYIRIPVTLRGEVAGAPFVQEGSVTLRRCNSVPGCAVTARQWRIHETAFDDPA